MFNSFLSQPVIDEAKFFIKECVQEALLHILNSGQSIPLASPISSKEEDVITTADVCKLLKISRPTVNDWMKSGKLPYKRLGRRVFFIRQDVLAALQSFNRRAK